jgi:general nucleoside transport system permease protein
VSDDGGDATPRSDPSGLGPQHTSVVARYGYAQRMGGLLAPMLTVVLAFLVGGLVILLTGHAPWSVYGAIFRGSGLNWFLPWVQGVERETAAFNLQQTLIVSASLVLTGLAVGFAFRCGLFNIGGQGQYLAGSIVAVIVGSNLEGMSPVLHIGFAVVLGSLAGAALAGVAGVLKATVGAHEVITTIMLNWVVVWVGVFLFTLTGPLQSTTTNAPISADVVAGARLPVIWGDPLLQGLHAGVFAAIGSLVVYWAILSRTTLGLGVKAVGFNPEAARYTGIEVGRSYVVAMAIAGTFAGLAGTIDILGWQFRLSTGDIQGSTVGFVGIAVALLGRNTAVGIGLAAITFGALLTGTSSRNLDPDVFSPQLGSSLTLLIQGLVVLILGADVLVLWLLGRLRKRPA